MKQIASLFGRLILVITFSIMNFSCAPASSATTPEIIVWPHQDTDTLPVARETAQAFYVMGYSRGAAVADAGNVEISVPAHWQIWQGSEAPPEHEAPDQAHTLSFSWKLRQTKDTADSRDYSAANSAGNLLLMVRPTPQAQKSTLGLKWLQQGNIVAERQVTLEPVELPFRIAPASAIRVGMWLNDPHFNAASMAELYHGLRRAGVNYVIISKAMYQQNSKELQQLGMRVFINQWWTFNNYMPDAPPPEAAATLQDGSIDKARWSPTYMANGGPAFMHGIEKIANELRQMPGVYGLMLDYEPGRKAMDADYGEASRRAFETHLGAKVLLWPEDVLPGGKHNKAWINFRNDQSEAYVNWFHKILAQRAPGLHLSVSTSGATGKPDDPNRVLAATDITQLSRAADAIHPQLYSWTSKLPAQLPRFMDKLELGKTTIDGAHAPVYPAVGSMAGKVALADPAYLRTQVLYWWLNGADGFEVWQYFYGVDGRYLALINEIAHLCQQAGNAPGASTAEILQAESSSQIRVLSRRSADDRKAWVGIFNLNATPAQVIVRPLEHWRIVGKSTFSVAPWSVQLVECVADAKK